MNRQKLMSIVLCAIAVVSLIFGIVCLSLDTGSYESDRSYGGDAYSGIQQAAACTARNVQTLIENINTISGLSFIVLALILAYKGVFGLLPEKKSAPVVEAVAYATAPVDHE